MANQSTQESSSLNNDSSVYQQELGSLIRDLRKFIRDLRDSEFWELNQSDLADILEEIIDG